jgi:hypothetical protein
MSLAPEPAPEGRSTSLLPQPALGPAISKEEGETNYIRNKSIHL